MKTRARIGLVWLAGLSLAWAASVDAQTPTPKAPAPPVKTTLKTWKALDALPLTCAQAWVQSGRTYPGLLAVVEVLARVSLANRDLTFPNTRDAGLDAGKGIAEDCKADPQALLFAIVDKHVRRVAEAAAPTGG
jgi:hypothetical protein